MTISLARAMIGAELVLGAQAPRACPPRSRVAVAFNHVVVAVRNLDSAIATYARLGFALKPGRAHESGIRNAHVKFRSGTEIELLTIGTPTDEWTRFYRSRLDAGDGPAALALHPRDLEHAGALLERGGLRIDRDSRPLGFPRVDPLRYVFFYPLNFSPTDRPEHFAHPNGADSVVAVWIATDSLGSEERLLRAFGGGPCGSRRIAPIGELARVYPLADLDALVLPWKGGASRPGVVGLTLHLSDFDRTTSLLDSTGIRPLKLGGSLFLPPEVSHGLWIELR